ncbi:MAG: DNA-directed RNA polymerase sigma-70 factor [Planctomycetota bacterium]|nr:MAG: DNA-directed RNA polymerase sigma-70 factor [Planctomycetota bacterium]
MSPPEQNGWIEAVVAEYERPLTRYALHMLGDVERARDVVQDVFLRCLAQDRDKLSLNLRAWLYTVCRNRVLDILRKESRMRTSDESGLLALKGNEPPPEQGVQQKEVLGRALQMLAALPQRQQEVLRLKFQDGLSYKEIAAVTTHSVSYVGVLLHEGMKTLRTRLAPLGPEA